MPWYIADYLADTAHLRAAQSGAYLHLIMHYWQRGGLPSENVQLAAIARMTDSEWKKARPIIEPFFQMPGWKHKRVEEELAKSQAKYEARASAGKKGGEAKAEGKQKSSNATPDEVAGLNQPQPQPPSLPKPDSKKGESNSPSKVLKVVGEGEDGPVLIDETYQPSDRAIEYAYSLGMKKIDLDDEHRKFITMSVAARAKSFNPDMSFKLFCDRWLQFKRKNNPDWKPEPEPVYVPQEPFVLVVQGTPEGNAHCQYNRENGLRPPFFCRHIVDGVEIVAAKAKWLIPPGYDEATGEKLAPSNEEENAA
jgi:uncharacterized protein YdaU (DUF1376 family)